MSMPGSILWPNHVNESLFVRRHLRNHYHNLDISLASISLITPALQQWPAPCNDADWPSASPCWRKSLNRMLLNILSNAPRAWEVEPVPWKVIRQAGKESRQRFLSLIGQFSNRDAKISRPTLSLLIDTMSGIYHHHADFTNRAI